MVKLAKLSLFLYIIIFTVTTSVVLNRAALLVTIFCCGLGYIKSYRELKMPKNRFFISLLLYGIMLYISRLYTITPAVKANAVFMSYAVMLIITFFLTVNVKNEDDIHFFLNAFVIASVVQLIYMLSVYGANIFEIIAKSDEGIRIGDEVSNSNSVGMSFAYGSMIALYFLLNVPCGRMKKLLYAAVVLMGIVMALFSGSRKALVMIFIGAVIIMYGKGNNVNILKAIVGFVTGICLLLLLYNVIKENEMFSVVYLRMKELLEGLSGKGRLDNSSKERLRMINTGMKAFSESPLWGQGIYASYRYFRTYAHNNFVEVLMNTGLIGFTIFYFPYIDGMIKFLRIDKTSRLYRIMLFLFLWILFGGVGMITYYDKYSNFLISLVGSYFMFCKKRES